LLKFLFKNVRNRSERCHSKEQDSAEKEKVLRTIHFVNEQAGQVFGNVKDNLRQLSWLVEQLEQIMRI
jgi:hypothetical protein